MHCKLTTSKITRKQAGFSLIELSVIIGVAATLAVGAMRWISPPTITQADKSITTNATMDKISDAITAFVAVNGRLPCPADPLMRIDGTRSTGAVTYNFGEEALNNKDCKIIEGTIPVNTLNLAPEDRLDGWGNELRYKVSTNLCGDDSATTNLPEVGCTVRDYREGLAGNGNVDGDITVSDGTTNLTTKAAFVIVSHGANAYDSYGDSGVLFSGAGGANEEENSDGDTTFVKKAFDTTYDDIVDYRTKTDLTAFGKLHARQLVTEAQCNANSTQLQAITTAMATNMNAQINDYVIGTYNTGEEVMLDLLWQMQEICGHSKYYGETASGTWLGKKCPGGGTYDSTQKICTCNDGSWDGAC
jgi:type II secretory pathway pseudopilin PulG